MSVLRSTSRRARALVGVAVLATTAGLAATVTAPAIANPTSESVSDGDWEVSTAPGGYEVTLELDAPLPIVSDAPTIVVDGQSLGVATESADGLSLNVFDDFIGSGK